MVKLGLGGMQDTGHRTNKVNEGSAAAREQGWNSSSVMKPGLDKESRPRRWIDCIQCSDVTPGIYVRRVGVE